MKPPLPVLIIGWFFIAAGTIGLIYHLDELNVHNLFSNDAVWLLFVRLLVIVGAILILRGSNAGRWLLILWLTYHVVLSYFHTLSELIVHIILLAVIIYALFHPKVTPFFRTSKAGSQSSK
jgi:hypothetical protein